ncbi:MAG TPA: hypothetical protein VNT75_18985 [Symbiobacteriaceae bacterium]|nr:hypothetical protein [Symbiobacteriaceae bacterium]
MESNRWETATVERGKPRVYIQQYLDLRMPEKEYLQIVKDLGLTKPFEEDTASQVMDAYIEDLADGSQFDAVHIQRGDGIVVLMTVVSFPFKQETMDRLLAAYLAKKALGTGE